jgi:hypothetical protein
MSLQHLSTLPPTTWPLTASFLITTPILWGNVGLSLCGPLPIIKEELGPSGLSKKDKVRVWALFFKRAGVGTFSPFFMLFSVDVLS